MPSFKRAVVACLMLSGAALSVSACQAAEHGDTDGWKLQQRQSVWGLLNVYITGDAVKIERKDRWGVMAKAPDWDASVYSIRRKLVHTIPYLIWRKQGFSLIESAISDLNMPNDVSTRKGVTDGLPSITRQWQGETPKMEFMAESRVEGRVCRFTLITTPAIRTAQQGKQFIAKFYKVPSADSVPIFCGNSAQKTPELKTYDIAHVKIPESQLALPASLARVSTDTEVWMDDGDKRNLDDFAQLFAAPGKN
jgi:hypothetical protein